MGYMRGWRKFHTELFSFFLLFFWQKKSPAKFSKKRGRGGFTWSQFLDGDCWARWGCDFLGRLVVQFLHENKLNSEIFSKKKSLLTKVCFSVSLYAEFCYFWKMGWELRTKKFVNYGGSLKNLILGVGS